MSGSSVPFSALEYPVRNIWHDWEIPFVGNDSMTWKGQTALLVDAAQKVYQAPGFVMDTPWYHCAVCETRLSIGAKFCPECGKRLDWEHTDERDPTAEAAVQAALDAKVAEVVASSENETGETVAP